MPETTRPIDSMSTIETLLDVFGVPSLESMGVNELIEVDRSDSPFMDLGIEKLSGDRLAVGHYYFQNGDMKRDPEIVFKIVDGNGWVPVEYRSDPTTHRHDSSGLDLGGFVEQWDENLASQNYVEAAENQVRS